MKFERMKTFSHLPFILFFLSLDLALSYLCLFQFSSFLAFFLVVVGGGGGECRESFTSHGNQFTPTFRLCTHLILT